MGHPLEPGLTISALLAETGTLQIELPIARDLPVDDSPLTRLPTRRQPV